MSDAVDTRIVEAKFDSSDFEKGVDKTVKKLDELKKALELKDTGKSITDLTKTANEGIEKAGNSLDKLSNRLTTFTGMVKNQLLGGLAQQVSNVFLQMEQGIMGFVHSISGGQVSAGLNKYTEILSAVRVMTASGIDQSNAYEAVKRLGEYSDQTSYSLSQMASGMSKLVAAGAKLDTAEKMMEGLANMAASAGVNVYEAQRAFLNFSQAYGSKSMQIRDWISFENLNMATKNVMDVFMQAGEQAGTLIKDKNGGYKTTNKTNKKVKGGKAVSNQGFRDTLNYGWLDQKTMEIATGALSYFEDLGVNLEEMTSEQLESFAGKAFQAAKEARSFADAIGTLRDVISTGWATTFEHIFGQLDKAKEFFTWLTESNLAEAIYSIGEYRNAVLEVWGQGDSVLGTSGRDYLLAGFRNLDQVVGSLHESFTKLMPDERSVGDWLYRQTAGFLNFTTSLREWFTTIDKETGKSRADRIAEAFGFIGTAFSIAGRTISTAWEAIKTVFAALEPTFDAVAIALGNFSASVDEMNKNTTVFDNISNAVKNILMIADPLLKVLPTILEIGGQIGTFFLGIAVDTFTLNVQLIAEALGFLLEVFGVRSAQMEKGTGVLEGIKNDITAMGNAAKSAIGAIRTFFDALFGDLKTLLGINKETGELEEGGLFANVKNFFDTNEFVASAKAWIDQAVIDVGSFIQSIPSRLSQFAINIRDVIHGLFYKKEAKSGSAKTKGPDSTLSDFAEYTEVETELKKWLDQAILDVKAFFADLPKKVSSAVGSFGSLISNFWHGLFYKKEYVNGKGGRQFKGEYIEVVTPLKEWVDQAIKDVKQFIKDLPKNIQNGIKEVGSLLEAFWHGLFYEKKQNNKLRGGAQTRLDELEVETPLKLWLDQSIRSVKSFIQNIPKYIQSAIKYTGSIIRALVNGLFGREDGEDVTADDILAQLRAPFKDLTLTKIIDDLKNIGKTLLNQVISIFTGTDDVETNSEVFATALAEGITWIRTKAEGAWKIAKEFIETLPDTIAGFFNGERTAEQIEANNKEQGPVELALRGFATSVGQFISEIPGTLLTFFDNAINEISKLWTRLYNSITGQDVQNAKATRAKKMINIKKIDVALEAEEGQVTSPFQQFVNRIGLSIQNIFSKLPQFIAEGIDLGIVGINSAIEWLGSWFADHSITGGDKVEDDLEGTEEQSGLIKAIGNLCSHISEIITTTVPDTLTKAWTWVSTNATEWKDKVGTILNDNGITWENLQKNVESIGTKIGDYVKEIPKYIDTGAGFFKDLLFGPEKTTTYVKEAVDEYGRVIDDAGTEMNTRTERTGGLWDVFKNIFVSVGPAILEGINEALKWVNTGFQKLTGMLNEPGSVGDKIAEAAGADDENSGLFKAIINLWETLKNFIIHTFPEFITAAFNEIKASLPNLLNEVFGGGTDSETEKQIEETADKEFNAFKQTYEDKAKEAQKVGEQTGSWWDNILKYVNPVSSASAESVEPDAAQSNVISITGATNALGGLLDSLNTINEKTGATTLIQLALVAHILSMLYDLFQISDEIESVTHGIAFAGLGIALAALGTVIGELGYFISTADIVTDEAGNTKIQSAKYDALLSFLQGFGQFFLDLTQNIALIAGLWKGFDALSEGFEMVGNLATKGTKQIAETAVKSGISAVGGGLLGGGLGAALYGLVNGLIGDLPSALEDLGTRIHNFTGIIAPALNDLRSMIGTLSEVAAVPDLLQKFIRRFWVAIAEANNDEELNNHGKFEDYADQYVREITAIGLFMSQLTNALKTWEEIKDPLGTLDKMSGEDFMSKFSNFVTKMLSSIQNGIINAMNPTVYGIEQIQDLSLQFELLGNALSVFGSNISGMTPASVQALSDTLDVINRLALTFKEESDSPLKDVINGKSDIVEFGFQIEKFSVSMKTFVDNLNAMNADLMDDTSYELLKRKIDLTGYAIESLSFYTNNLGVLTEDRLERLTTFLPSLSSLTTTFVNELNTGLSQDINTERLNNLATAIDIFESLANAAYQLEDTNITKASENIKSFMQELSGSLTQDQERHMLASGESGFQSILQSWIDSLQLTGAYSPEITPVISADALRGSIDQALTAPFTINLQPAIDEALSIQIAGLHIPEPIDYTGRLATIEGSISTLNSGMHDIASSIRNMKIVVNGGGTAVYYDNGRRNSAMTYP